MTSYLPPLDDMRFVINHTVDLAALRALPGGEALEPELVDQVLAEAGRFAAQELAPLNPVGDREPARLENGVVRTSRGFKEAYGRFVAAGWNGLPFPAEWGGQDLPWTLATAVAEMVHSANMSFGLCPVLTQAGVELLLRFGSAEQQACYLPKLVSGEWTGTMCLTEPQAGTDVGALRTRAVPDGAHYRLFGTKIFITYGEHDYTDNIVHMVLARLPDAPEGTRGISLFLVPKFLVNDDGSLGARNDLRCVSLEHKLGIHASPTCVMSFGDNEGAIGYLVGEPQGGMRAMFTMMNNARLAVGIQGLAIAERAYQAACAYADQRVQGRLPGGGPIVGHPDVRRTLITMRCQIEAMRAMAYLAAAAMDHAGRASEPAARAAAQARLDLLIPLVKAWCSDQGFELASLALQIHGGMGYIEETGVAQYLRDARIAMIYEGTNGIQALDLVGRKLGLGDGAAVNALFDELRSELAPLAAAPALRAPLADGLAALEQATRWLQATSARAPEAAQAGATPYLRMFAVTLGGFLLARQMRLAAASGAADAPARHASAAFYITQLLPPATALLPAVTAGIEPLAAGQPA